MLLRDNLVIRSAEQQHRRLFWDQGDLGGRVPFLVTEEGEGGQEWDGGGDQARDGGECVFEDEGTNLLKDIYMRRRRKA